MSPRLSNLITWLVRFLLGAVLIEVLALLVFWLIDGNLSRAWEKLTTDQRGYIINLLAAATGVLVAAFWNRLRRWLDDLLRRRYEPKTAPRIPEPAGKPSLPSDKVPVRVAKPEVGREAAEELNSLSAPVAPHHVSSAPAAELVRGMDILPDLRRNLGFLLKEIEAGRVVPFIGAGVSTEAGLPTGSQLAQRLADEMEREYRNEPLNQLAQWYKVRYGRAALIRFLRRQLRPVLDLRDPDTCLSYRLLAHLPFRLILTTNLDTVLEDTLVAEGGQVVVIKSDQMVGTPLPDAVTVLKVHGDLETSSMVITTDDYHDYARNFPNFLSKQEVVFRENTVLFMGYGLDDVVFRSLHRRVQHDLGPFQQKAYAVVGPDFNADLAHEWHDKNTEIIAVDAYSLLLAMLRKE